MLYFFLYLTLFVCSMFKYRRSLHMLQQNLYNENNRYIKWTISNARSTFFNFSLFALIVAVSLIFIRDSKMITFTLFIAIATFFVSIVKEYDRAKQNQNKKPLVYTARIKRLMLTIFVVNLIPIVLFIITKSIIFVAFSMILVSLAFFTVFLALIINMPIEKLVYKHYEHRAKNKLKSMKDLKIIGITGSYGKTSCKNILNDILNVKFNTLATPKSLNTFNGLMITINNKLSKFDDVFIAEMGAYVKGEINGLCDLVNPKYGIITSIGTAHLETFGSEENIQSGKMELIEHLPIDGVGILNRDDPKQVSYKIKNDCKIIWIGIDNKEADVYATNIKTKGIKTYFDVVFKGDKKKYEFETKLLSRHNVYNILSAIALGYELGIDIKDLQTSVRRVKPVEHRLEIKKLGNFYQIDDAYNSNPVGAKSALDVLDRMDGYKVVVTPGMIELGDKEEELNKEFGKQISKVADLVILIGEKRTKPIYEGLLEERYPKEKIKVLNDVRESFLLISNLNKKNVYALYENDLPDTYNE